MTNSFVTYLFDALDCLLENFWQIEDHERWNIRNAELIVPSIFFLRPWQPALILNRDWIRLPQQSFHQHLIRYKRHQLLRNPLESLSLLWCKCHWTQLVRRLSHAALNRKENITRRIPISTNGRQLLGRKLLLNYFYLFFKHYLNEPTNVLAIAKSARAQVASWF